MLCTPLESDESVERRGQVTALLHHLSLHPHTRLRRALDAALLLDEGDAARRESRPRLFKGNVRCGGHLVVDDDELNRRAERMRCAPRQRVVP